MANAPLGKQDREILAFFNACGSNQNGLTLGVTLHDVFNNHVELNFFVLIDKVRLVLSNHRLVSWNWNNSEFVN